MDSLAVTLYKQRREARLAARGIRVKKKQYRKAKDLKKLDEPKSVKAYRNDRRMDAEGDDDQQNKQEEKHTGGGHGNTRLPFGLCKKYGIEVGDSWTPRDAWDALAGKGITPDVIYKKLRAGEELGPEAPEPPKKDPVKTIDSGEKYYIKELRARKGWGPRGASPWVLEGTAEWKDDVPEDERYGYRRSRLGSFHTTTDMYLFLKRYGIEEFQDPETGEIVNPSEMELPHVAYTDGERGYSAITIGMKGERYVVTGTDFDGKKKAIEDFSTLANAKAWLESRQVSDEDIKLSPALKKREAERVSWKTSDKKAYVELDGKKYGDLHVVRDKWGYAHLYGEAEDGEVLERELDSPTDVLRYLKDLGVEDVRMPDKKHINPMEAEIPEAVARISGKYYQSFRFGVRDFGVSTLALYGTDLDGVEHRIDYASSLDTASSFMERALRDAGLDKDMVEIDDGAKAYIEERKKEEEERDRRIKEFPEKAVAFGSSRWLDLRVEKTGDDKFVLRGYDEHGRDRTITTSASMAALIEHAEIRGFDLGSILNDKEVRDAYDQVMERKARFAESAEDFGGDKYVDIELKKEDFYYKMYGYDEKGKRRTLTSGGDFIDIESELSYKKPGGSIESYIKDPEVKKDYEAHKKRMAEFESKAIEVDGTKYADIELEPSRYSSDEFVLSGYTAKGKKEAVSYGARDMYDAMREVERIGLRPEDIIKDPQVKSAYEKYKENKEKFDAEAADFGGIKYRDLRITYDKDALGGLGRYALRGTDIRGRDRALAYGSTAKALEDEMKSTGGREDYTIESFKATPEMEERKKVLQKTKDAVATGEYTDMGIEGSAFKKIHADKIGDKWSIKGIDIDGIEKQITETYTWDETVDELEKHGAKDYQLLTKNKTYSRPTDGMRHVMLLRGMDGNFKVYADTATKGAHAEVYSTPSEDEARKWLEDNNVSAGEIRTRGMNPNDDVPRSHTQSSLANFDSYRMQRLERSFVERMTDDEKKETVDMLTEIFSQGSYRVARSTSSFGGIIENGYKSQIETGKGGAGAFIGKDERKRVSGVFYGHGDLPDTEYEKCGYIGLADEADDWDDSSHPFYGGGSPMTYTLRKDTLKDRTTYTYGDSLNTKWNISSAGYAGDKPTIEGVTSLDTLSELREALQAWRRYKAGEIDYKAMFKKIRRNADNRYIELQFHGPVTVKDIEKVSFNEEADIRRAFDRMKPQRRKRVVKALMENNVGILYRRDGYGEFMDAWDFIRLNYPDAFESDA